MTVPFRRLLPVLAVALAAPAFAAPPPLLSRREVIARVKATTVAIAKKRYPDKRYPIVENLRDTLTARLRELKRPEGDREQMLWWSLSTVTGAMEYFPWSAVPAERCGKIAERIVFNYEPGAMRREMSEDLRVVLELLDALCK